MGSGIVTWGTDPKAKTIRVYYEGTDTPKEGYALCYNHDTTTNWTGVSSADLTTETSTTAEGYQNEGKFIRVEKPAAANQRFFAGVITGSFGVGAAGPNVVDVLVPNGATIPVWTDVSVSIGDPCYLEPAAYTFTNVNTAGGIQVGWFDETIDRSGTNGLALAKITGPNVWAGGDVQSARSRAATALPTSAIWQNFDLADLRTNPFSGSFLEADFNRGELADDIFQTDTSAAVFNLPGSGGIGEMVLFTSADNEEAAVQWNCPIDVSGGNKWGFEARVKVENITDARATAVLGLMFRTAEQAGDVVADNGAALTDGDFVGFVRFAADGDIWDFIYDEGGQSTNTHDDDYLTAEADTYATLGMYFNGTTIQGYVDGVATGTAIVASDISAADFPTDAIVVPTLAVKGDNAADFDYSIDWIRVAQHA